MLIYFYIFRHLVVTKSVDNRRLWVNGIPKSKSTAEIRYFLHYYLKDKTVDIVLTKNDVILAYHW